LTNRTADIQTWLNARSDEMAALLIKLIAEDTENPPGRGLGQCARILHEAMDRLGLSPEIMGLPPSGSLEEPCIVHGSAGNGDKLVYFHGHFDVVPVQDRAQFRAERGDGRITGRGSADMKGGIVSMLYGAAAARELGLLGDGRIVIHLVCDEETGSVAGSGYLREQGLIDPTALAMLTAEPSSGSIWNAARGAVSLRVSVRGKEAHVGQANLGVNAFEQMLHIAEPLTRYADEMTQRHTSFKMDPNDPRGSMVVVGGMSGSGSNFNVVPGSAWFSVDSRFNPEEDIESELKRMKQIIQDAADSTDADVTIEVTQFQPPARTEETHPAARSLAASIEEVTGSRARFEMCAGVLDVRWYAQLGIPAFGYGAGRLDVSHGPHEYIEEASMRYCAAVYADYARRLLA
jgi:acetylornithine deacetylase/succinyl-diaminopimelate desuccinylase family protein